MNEQDERVVEHLHGLRLTSDEPYTGPGPAAARARAVQRRHHQRGWAVLVLLVAVVIAAFAREETMRLRPADAPGPDLISEAPYTAPEPRGSSAPFLRSWDISWADLTLDLPTNDVCPDRQVTFASGTATVGSLRYSIRADAVASGDVTGDGVTESVVVIECSGTAETAGPEPRYLVAVYGEPVNRGGPVPLGALYAEQASVDPRVSIDDGTILVDLRPANGSRNVQSFRWRAGAFTRVR